MPVTVRLFGLTSVPKDAVSVGARCKWKKLVRELGGVKQAKTVVDAAARCWIERAVGKFIAWWRDCGR
ncbi:MAG: hypothetical protein FJ276_31970 [Planctomycetes bacterium]|nr:hypothetical protein [Planctomycetota bacterium]